MARPVTLDRFRLSPQYWAHIMKGEEEARRIGQQFTSNKFFVPETHRFGFATCAVVADTVVGYFAHEGTRTDVTYDHQNQQIRSPRTPYAHIMFAFVISTGQVAIQRTKLQDYEDLTVTDMKRAFPIAVNEMLKLGGVQVARLTLERDRVTLTHEDLYKYYKQYRTSEMEITNLANKDAPTYEEFKLFNPRENTDRIYRQVFEEDTHNGLDTITLQTKDDGDLRNVNAAKLGAYMGEIKRAKLHPREGQRGVVYTTTFSTKFTVSVRSEDEKEPFTADEVIYIRHLMTMNPEEIDTGAPAGYSDIPPFDFTTDDDDDDDE